jgi:hypothetical protein
MKIRLGFITNSSSTNHIIMWKGDKYDLKKLLIERISIFPTNFSSYKNYQIEKVNVLDAILSMIEAATDKEAMIKELQERLDWAERWYKNAKNYSYSKDYAKEALIFAKKLVELSKNKDWMLEVSFGDSEGNFKGGDLGYVMDYEGRYINVEEDDFAYKTEQNR